MAWRVVVTFQNEAIPVKERDFEQIGAKLTAKVCRTEDEIIELARRASQEVIRVLTGEWPQALVNPEVKETFNKKWGKANLL